MTSIKRFRTGRTYIALVDETLAMTIKLVFVAVEIDEIGRVKYIFTKQDETRLALDDRNLRDYFNHSDYEY